MGDAVTEAARWIRSRPDTVKALMRRFPPACEIDSPGDHYSCPGAFGNAAVIGYLEDGETLICIRVGWFAPMDPIHYHVDADKVRVVECAGEMGFDRVAEILDGG